MKLILKFGFERETKGAIRYQELDADGIVETKERAKMGTLYLRKVHLPTPYPQSLIVTVADGKE